MKKPKTFYSQSFEIQEYLNWQEQQIKELKVQNKSYAAHEKEVLDKFNQDKSLEQQIKKLKDEKDLETLAKNDLQERNEIQFKQIKELEESIEGVFKQGFDEGANLPYDDNEPKNNFNAIEEYNSIREASWFEYKKLSKH